MHSRYSLLLAFPLIFTLGLIYLFFEPVSENTEYQQSYSINAVIGDESFIQTYGKKPGEDISDDVRIQTHLSYVESVLRNRPTEHLTKHQKKNREKYLDLLNEYIIQGEFPYNDGHEDPRRPTFISENGHICAVGFLVEKAAGREVAEEVNKKYKFAFIPDIDHPKFIEWAEKSGFTIQELAMIQPAYGPQIIEKTKLNNNKIEWKYGVSSSLFTGANALYLSNRSDNPWMFNNNSSNHWFGLAAGTGSVLFGVLNVGKNNTYIEPMNSNMSVNPNTGLCFMGCPLREVTETNRARDAVSITNIGIGVFSMARAGYRLLSSSDDEPDPSGFGVTQLQADPIQNRDVVPALSYRVTF